MGERYPQMPLPQVPQMPMYMPMHYMYDPCSMYYHMKMCHKMERHMMKYWKKYCHPHHHHHHPCESSSCFGSSSMGGPMPYSNSDGSID
jgi:hypothetical protein